MWPSFKILGDHRAACSRSGLLGKRGYAFEAAAARICREAGARVRLNVFVRDMNTDMLDVNDNRRIEIVADNLRLFGGAQLAVDTTLVSPLQRDGSACPGAADTNGVAAATAERRKARLYQELTARGSRARLVVLAVETGGRWSSSTWEFVRSLSLAKALEAPRPLQAAAAHAWRRRWSSILACGAQRALAESILGFPAAVAGGDLPALSDALAEYRHEPGAAVTAPPFVKLS